MHSTLETDVNRLVCITSNYKRRCIALAIPQSRHCGKQVHAQYKVAKKCSCFFSVMEIIQALKRFSHYHLFARYSVYRRAPLAVMSYSFYSSPLFCFPYFPISHTRLPVHISPLHYCLGLVRPPGESWHHTPISKE